MDRKIIAAVLVAALVVMGGAAALVLNSDSDDGFSYDPTGYPAYMAVLGNADLDNDFDADDVSKIRGFVDSPPAEYGYGDYYMYDADYDGDIDADDAAKVEAIVSAIDSGDWSGVGKVHYVNVDLEIAAYDMTKNNKVITLIAPPLDSVLAMGGQDLVVGTDSRITTGKYHAEYASTFNFDELYDVGSCGEPDTEVISKASKEYSGVNVVCGTRDSYGPTLEKVFSGTDVQIIRIASWEYGGTLYGFMTLGFLLKLMDGATEYFNWYNGVIGTVQNIVDSVDPGKRSEGKVGAAACYGYLDELSLLGEYSGEYANLMALDPFDSAEDYLSGKTTGGHGDALSAEGISAMYQQNHLRNLILMVGAPFQVSAGYGAQASRQYMEDVYDKWYDLIGVESMEGLSICVTGYSFSTGVSEVLNRLVLCYYLYNEEFLEYFGLTTQEEAQEKIGEYVDAYCRYIHIDGLWSFHGGSGNGMNLLYCGEGSEMNILNGF